MWHRKGRKIAKRYLKLSSVAQVTVYHLTNTFMLMVVHKLAHSHTLMNMKMYSANFGTRWMNGAVKDYNITETGHFPCVLRSQVHTSNYVETLTWNSSCCWYGWRSKLTWQFHTNFYFAWFYQIMPFTRLIVQIV